MTFYYAVDFRADAKGVPQTVMRPRLPIRISNVLPARQGGSDRGYAADALPDSGADITFITREAAEFINIDFDNLSKTVITTPLGEFETYRTFVRLEVVHDGRRIDLGKTPSTIPEKDTVKLGNRPFILAGRSNIFDQYSMKFDDYKQVLIMEKTGQGPGPRVLTHAR